MIPNIIRNYNVAHKLILISEQGGVEVFHNSAISFWEHPEYASYGKIWETYGWPLIKRELNQTEYSPSIWYTGTAKVSDAFWAGSINNIREQPLVYITNIVYNMKQIVFYNLDYWGGKYFKQNAKHLAGLLSFRFFLQYFFFAGTLASIFLVIKPQKSNLDLSLIFIAILLVVSYSLVFYYPRYNYIKIPIFLISLASLLQWLWSRNQGRFVLKSVVLIFLITLFIVSILPLYYFVSYL